MNHLQFVNYTNCGHSLSFSCIFLLAKNGYSLKIYIENEKLKLEVDSLRKELKTKKKEIRNVDNEDSFVSQATIF